MNVTHDYPLTPLLFAAITRGHLREIVLPKITWESGGKGTPFSDLVPGDLVALFEYDEHCNRRTVAPSVTVRVTSVLGHDDDCYRISFELVGESEKTTERYA
jgi:hypothetical protein